MEQEPPKYKVCDLDEREDVRSDIYTAIDVFHFLNTMEAGGDFQLENRLSNSIIKAKKDCIEIVCKWINLLKEAD